MSTDSPKRPFRFLTDTADHLDGPGLAVFARRVESLGYSAVMTSDHLTAHYAPVPFLATVAAATERLRVGTFVFNTNLRHPAVLAQDLATIDRLSGGRLEIREGESRGRRGCVETVTRGT